jgi:adenylate kinase family enzyme
MHRVLVVGCPGAGKTIFAHRLSQTLGLPLIYLDVHYWRPDWQPPAVRDWRARAAVLAEGDQWVMDGNFFGTMDLRMPRADTLVWLDLARYVCLRRALIRGVRDRGRRRPDLPAGCFEQFSWAFLREIWRFPGAEAAELRDRIATFGNHLRLFRLTSRSDLSEFFAALGKR